MRILFVSSEIYPFAKTGGLADVSAALPKALRDKGEEVISVMPLFSVVDIKKHGIKKSTLAFDIILNSHLFHFDVYQKDATYFIANPALFKRDSMYGEYDDNAVRFGFFAYAVMKLAEKLGGRFDVFHLNDWQSALVAYLAKTRLKKPPRVVLTIHNLAFQGVFHKRYMNDLEIGWDAFTMHRFEFFDKINFLKGAIAYSDSVIAASPRYAEEIQTKAYGCDLDSFLRDNAHKLSGILNGIDVDEFNPAKDPFLQAKYRSVLSKKRDENKAMLLERLGLENPQWPLFIFIGRFAWQKGVGTILEAMQALGTLRANVAILGSGDPYYNDSFASLSHHYPNVAVTLGYDEALARTMYASADFMMMPSVYEPCGLNQMIAMRYGAIPIVRETGGLADSVGDMDDVWHDATGVGIVFKELDRYSFLTAIARGLALYNDKERFSKVIEHNGNVDNAWATRADDYLAVYRQRR